MQNFLKMTFVGFLVMTSRLLFAQTDSIKEQFTFTEFAAIKASGIAHIYLTPGNQEKVEVEANYKNIYGRLKMEVIDKVLNIRLESDRSSWSNNYKDVRLDIYITYKKLDRLEGSGAIRFYAENPIAAKQLDLKLSAASNSKLNLQVSTLKLEISGAAKVDLTGKAEQFMVQANGASRLQANKLLAQEVKIEANGVSHNSIYAGKTLDMKANGMSRIKHEGNARVTSKEVSRMANVD